MLLVTGMPIKCDCKNCKQVKEHVASFLPFKVLEATKGKPLRISSVAMAIKKVGG